MWSGGLGHASLGGKKYAIHGGLVVIAEFLANAPDGLKLLDGLADGLQRHVAGLGQLRKTFGGPVPVPAEGLTVQSNIHRLR